MRRFVLILLLFLTNYSFAQQPSYFLFGENQFKGIQIYDVIQDNKLNYWYATNEGLYKYNYVNFEKIECQDAKSSSVFNFVKDKLGNIYCHNLNNQVFKLQNDKCRLLYELSAEEAGADLHLAIADDGNILMGAKVIIVMGTDGKVKRKIDDYHRYLGQPFTLDNGTVLFHLGKSDSLLIYSKGKHEYKELDKRIEALSFVQNKEQLFAVDLATKDYFQLDFSKSKLRLLGSNEVLKRSPSVRLYATTHGTWIAGTLPGVVLVNSFKTMNFGSAWYENFFISDVFVDHEGNTLLSTFDQGILVIPDIKVDDALHQFEDDPVTSFFAVAGCDLFFGSSKGILWKSCGSELQQLSNQGKRPIEVITGNDRFVIYDDGLIRYFDKKKQRVNDLYLASLKAGVCLGEDQFLLGTNRGLLSVKFEDNGKAEIYFLNELRCRIHLVTYDEKDKSTFISSAEGLFQRSEGGKLKKLKYKNKDLFPLSLYTYRSELYVSTRENGILVFKNGQFKRKIQVRADEKELVLKKIIIVNNLIYASGSNGLYQLDLNGKIRRSIHAQFGFASKRIIDFSFHNGELWVSHDSGLQKIDLSHYFGPTKDLLLRFEKVAVNGILQDHSAFGKFSSSQKKVQFVFSSPTLRYNGLVTFYYRLVGVDSNWTICQNGINQVTFNSLSPGVYKFEVKAEFQDKTSKILSYKFEIDSPFYLKWWFILLSFVVFFALVYYIYKRQLSIQRKKSELLNELNASKLTAIQSQMNPHFIFNSLNSIQDLILKGDVENSYSYITTFSNLVRNTLSYSEKDFIAFEQEIKLLELYLSLEKLRFKKDFDYVIDYKGIEDILIPPLLIQPFVENALVHGLLHKQGLKKLQITFSFGEELICTIEDNGVGRDAAREIRMRQRGDHESFSSEAIRKRFEILTKVLDGEFGYHFEDMVESGEAKGTKVILKIPFKNIF